MSDDIQDPEVLKMLKKKDMKGLIAALKDPDMIVKKSAARALQILIFYKKLNKPSDEPVLEAMLEAIDDPDIGDIAIAALRDSEYSGRAEVFLKLVSSHHIHRRTAVTALNLMAGRGDIKKDVVVEALIKMIADKEAGVRQKVAEVLGDLLDKRALEPLIKMTGDGDAEVRQRVVKALGTLGDERAVEPLIKMTGDDDPEVRRRVAEVLGDLRDERAVEPLIEMTGDDNAQVRQRVAGALCDLCDERAVEPLIKMMRDDSAEVRQMAAQALGSLGDKRAGEVLSYAHAHDEDDDVRQYAGDSLEELGLEDESIVDARFKECVGEIIQIYSRGKVVVSVGNVTASVDEMKIQNSGELLDKLGGIELMKSAYAAFCQYTDWPPSVRQDLFKLWVGIGDWGREN